MATFRELLVSLGNIRTVEPIIDHAYEVALLKRFVEQEGDAPHGRPWHVSFHASSFPGDEEACPRFAMYGLMDVPKGGPIERWLDSVAQAGKTFELGVVRAARDAGFLLRSNQPGRSSDPDAIGPDNLPMPQMGFEEEDTWLTGSVDMPLMVYGSNNAHPVEIKSKHESDILKMQMGEKSYDEKHRKQLMCSLGMAHDHPDAFLHPTEDRLMDVANDGTVYYGSRDTKWPGPVETFEFYFQYDPAFMEQGREQLRSFRDSFINGELPMQVKRVSSRTHPNGPGWRWSEGACKYCPLKKVCRADFDNDINKIADSNALTLAAFSRPGYDPAAKRQAVFSQWNMQDPLAP